MNRILFSLSFVLFAWVGFAQPKGFVPLKDPASFQQKFAQATQQITSLESDFTQVKHMEMLKDQMNSSGKFYYKRANKVRIEYKKPFSYLMVLNQQEMMVKDEQKQSNFNTRSNKMMQSINRVMIDCMSGNVYQNKDFSTSVSESNSEYLLLLTPVNTTMKKMFSRIEVYIGKQDYQVTRLNMVESGGDHSVMTFTNRMNNKVLDEKLFATK